jgi:Lecithin retinol acyltransferase
VSLTYSSAVVGVGKVAASGGRHRGPVEEVSLEQFTNGRPLWVRYERSACFDPDEVIRRARSRIGEDRYRLLTNNREHCCEADRSMKDTHEHVTAETVPHIGKPDCLAGVEGTSARVLAGRGRLSFEALVFDVDGTLAETEETRRQAFNEAFCAGRGEIPRPATPGRISLHSARLTSATGARPRQ